MHEEVKKVIHSTVLWTILFTIAVFAFLTWGARPALHLLGLLFQLMGGQGLEGTGL